MRTGPRTWVRPPSGACPRRTCQARPLAPTRRRAYASRMRLRISWAWARLSGGWQARPSRWAQAQAPLRRWVRAQSSRRVRVRGRCSTSRGISSGSVPRGAAARMTAEHRRTERRVMPGHLTSRTRAARTRCRTRRRRAHRPTRRRIRCLGRSAGSTRLIRGSPPAHRRRRTSTSLRARRRAQARRTLAQSEHALAASGFVRAGRQQQRLGGSRHLSRRGCRRTMPRTAWKRAHPSCTSSQRSCSRHC